MNEPKKLTWNQREYRRNPRYKEAASRASRAEGRAKTRLGRMYRASYQRLYQEELDKIYEEKGPLPDGI